MSQTDLNLTVQILWGMTGIRTGIQIQDLEKLFSKAFLSNFTKRVKGSAFDTKML